MKRGMVPIVLILGVLLVAGLALVLPSASLSARGKPGRVETYLATKAKRYLVSRSARGLESPPLPATSFGEGLGVYSGSCASCHGVEGHSATEIGRGLYPPAPDLSSAAVQHWSDGELFWIIKNGIRLTGMPAFGDIHSDREIWNLVYYLRSLDPPAEE